MCSRSKDKIPVWDLPTVLQGLMTDAFNPLEELSLAQLTLKTVFLVAICSARRIGELQALDCRPAYCAVGLGGVMLRTRADFLPKVPSLANIEKKIEFAPYGLAEDGSDLPERSLCVCRALECYLEATKDIRQSTQLFVLYGSNKKGQKASKATLARWVKDAIQAAYNALDQDPPQGVKAHSTRHASASWADLRGVSVLDICQQANWTTPHTFLKHYKLDLSNSVSARHAMTILDAHV
jgi:integrase